MKRVITMCIVLLLAMGECLAESPELTKRELMGQFITETEDCMIWSSEGFTIEFPPFPTYSYNIELYENVTYHFFLKKAIKGLSNGGFMLNIVDLPENDFIANNLFVQVADQILDSLDSIQASKIDDNPGVFFYGTSLSYGSTCGILVLNNSKLLSLLYINPDASIEENYEYIKRFSEKIEIEEQVITDFNYKKVSRNPDSYLYTISNFTGTILQVMETEDSNNPGYVYSEYLLYTDEAGEDMSYVVYYRMKGEPRLLERLRRL